MHCCLDAATHMAAFNTLYSRVFTSLFATLCLAHPLRHATVADPGFATMQLVGDMMNKKTAPRTALMLPAMVYAHLVLLDIVNVKGETHTQSARLQRQSMLLKLH